MRLDVKDFAEECARQALFFGVNAHFLMAVAELRSRIDDDRAGEAFGPFRLTRSEWESHRVDTEFGLNFTPENIRDWQTNCAVFAAMVLKAQRECQKSLGRSPSAIELYRRMWLANEGSSLPDDLRSALDATAPYVVPALEKVSPDLRAGNVTNFEDIVKTTVIVSVTQAVASVPLPGAKPPQPPQGSPPPPPFPPPTPAKPAPPPTPTKPSPPPSPTTKRSPPPTRPTTNPNESPSPSPTSFRGPTPDAFPIAGTSSNVTDVIETLSTIGTPLETVSNAAFPDGPPPSSQTDTPAPPPTPEPPPAPSPAPPPTATTTSLPEPGANEDKTQFVADDAEVEQDQLGRGVLAIALARRLHRIWCSLNGFEPPDPPPQPAAADAPAPADSSSWTGAEPMGASCFFDRARDNTRAAFVMHLDAPWGGGKTTFANFLARVMNPYGFEQSGESFLNRRYGNIQKRNVGAIFLEEPQPLKKPGEPQAPPQNEKPAPEWPPGATRPWIIVSFNAWQVEHCSPPWWVFYQAIRKRCFSSILCEGNAAVDLKDPNPPVKPGLLERWLSFAWLWWNEYRWRLTNPKVKTLLATAAFSFALLAALAYFKIIDFVGKDGDKVAFVGGGIGLLLAGISTIGTIWGVGALITESIVPGTNTLAERMNLGSGDPFERFRRHFYKSIERLKRPVMVIVDDLDRCKPEFIVDLVRGIQTLLRSPRVVFVILGDRDWIERAFETHHKAMSKINVGPEQTFGARFVEKAIQMSFVLPKLPPNRQADYVRRILIGRNAPRRGPKPEELKQVDAEQVRQAAQQELAKQEGGLLDPKAIQEKVMATLQQGAATASLPTPEVVRTINEEIAIQGAASAQLEKEIMHRLEPLADYFPANPRQIKRIINAVTMYHAVSVQWADEKKSEQPASSTDEERWFQLALWIIVMTEWPETWRLLASFPDLADLIPTKTPADRLATIPAHKLPGSEKATRAEIDRIRSDVALMALITGDGDRAGPVLDTAAIRDLVNLTPVYARRSRLEDKDDKKGKDAKGDNEPAEAK
jgi:hypothetical protein